MPYTPEQIEKVLNDEMIPYTVSEICRAYAALLRKRALQGLADQAQELGLGYGEQAKGAQGDAGPIYPNNARAALSYGFSRGFIAACRWPEPIAQDVHSKAFNDECEKFVEANAYLYTAPRAAVPDEVMVSLNEIRADINYLFGRVAVDGSFMRAAIDSVRIKLDRVANWLSAAQSDGGE